MTELDVYLYEDRIGRLERLPQARLGFRYEPGWVERGGGPVSLSLPVREEPFTDEECRPFFKGLLPEGEFLKTIARVFHISAENSFTVLEEIGGECAGAISLVPRDATPPFLSETQPLWLGEGDLGGLIEDLPNPQLLDDPDADGVGFRLSLAGTQDKLPILWGEKGVGITRGHPPSTHIIKKPAPALEAMVANEAYCLALASAAGLTAAEARPLAAGAQEGLLVTRYDRRPEAGGDTRRIHQEDLCQALGILPEQKYQAEGGPGVAAVAELIRRYVSAPAVDLLAFLDALILNLLIGNSDAHGKNYSLLLEEDGGRRLAPLYDLLSARAYWPFERKMAMKYGGEYRANRIRGRHLDRLADDLGIAGRAIRARVLDLSDRVVAVGGEARGQLPAPWSGAELLDRTEALIAETAAELHRAATEPSG